jgi:flagellar hook-length control protein FliK
MSVANMAKQKISIIGTIAVVGIMVLILATGGGFFKNFSVTMGYSTVSYGADPWGSATKMTCTPSPYVANGTQVTLTVSPASGYAFTYWNVTCPPLSGEGQKFYTNPVTFTIEDDTDFQAVMTQGSQQQSVTLTVDNANPKVAQQVWFTISTNPKQSGTVELQASANGATVMSTSATLASNGMALLSQTPSQYSALYGNTLSWTATINGYSSNSVITKVQTSPTPTPTHTTTPMPTHGTNSNPKDIFQQIIAFFQNLIKSITDWFNSIFKI